MNFTLPHWEHTNLVQPSEKTSFVWRLREGGLGLVQHLQRRLTFSAEINVGSSFSVISSASSSSSSSSSVASYYPSSTSSYDVESALSLQNVHQLTQPIINNLLAVFQCVHVEEWSLLNEFLDGFDFVFEFPDLDPQVISNLAVIEDYGLFSSFLSTPSRISLSCLCHVSRCVKKRTELKKCDPAGEG